MKKQLTLGFVTLAILTVSIGLRISLGKSDGANSADNVSTRVSVHGVDSRVRQVVVPSDLAPDRVRHAGLSGSVIYALSLDDVIGTGRTIIVGRPLQDFIQGRSHFVRYHERDRNDNDPHVYPAEQWTIGDFLVTRVLQQGSTTQISVGQVISVSEPVGLLDYGSSGFIESVIEDCSELKQNSTYVLFVEKYSDGSYLTTNFNLGRFNIDGTDPDDEIGTPRGGKETRTDKQKLREQLTARFEIDFVSNTVRTSK